MIRVAAVQTEPRFGEVDANIARAAEMVLATEADLYVLPELCNTGYLFRDRQEAHDLAEEFPQGPTTQKIAALSAEAGGVIVAGFAERTRASRIYNAALVCDRGEPLGCYRKIQLFHHEFEWFDAGDQPPRTYASSAGRVGPLICFDWIYPELTRCLALEGTQILTHATNLVLPFCQDATVTRCLENRVFSVLANRIGREARHGREIEFTGCSQITSPRGERLAQAAPDREEVLCAEIEPALADDKRVTPANDLLRDRRPGLYRRLWE